jgi:hypothetical protein
MNKWGRIPFNFATGCKFNPYFTRPQTGRRWLSWLSGGALVISPYHPYGPLTSHGDPITLKAVRHSLLLYMVVKQCARDKVACTADIREKAYINADQDHEKIVNNTRQKLRFILSPSLFVEVLLKKPTLLHYDPSNLFAALDNIANLDLFFTLTDLEQRTLLAKVRYSCELSAMIA